jgi:acyl CoA:acetate/3-ketoacid CoA transferase beta subunit
MSHSITLTEYMVVAISRTIGDGDMLLEGIGTFLPTSAYMLAQATHAPKAMRLCPTGNMFVPSWHRLSCSDYEFSTIQRGLYAFDYHEVNAAYLPSFLPGERGSWKEFLRPAQIDATGRTNNVMIGESSRPTVRLPGAAGLPDGIPIEPQVFMYIPRHDRRAFVERVDFISSPGTTDGAHPFRLVTDLGVFGFGVDGHMRVEALFPGVDRDMVRAATGFSLNWSSPLADAPEPTAEELSLLRNDIDPTGLREVERLTGSDRLALLHDVARREPGFSKVREVLSQLYAAKRMVN